MTCSHDGCSSVAAGRSEQQATGESPKCHVGRGKAAAQRTCSWFHTGGQDTAKPRRRRKLESGRLWRARVWGPTARDRGTVCLLEMFCVWSAEVAPQWIRRLMSSDLSLLWHVSCITKIHSYFKRVSAVLSETSRSNSHRAISSLCDLGRCLHFSAPWFPYFQNGDDKSTCVTGWSWRLRRRWLRKHCHARNKPAHSCPRPHRFCLIRASRAHASGHRCAPAGPPQVTSSSSLPYCSFDQKTWWLWNCFSVDMEKHRVVFAAIVSIDYGKNKRPQSCWRASPSVSPNLALWQLGEAGDETEVGFWQALQDAAVPRLRWAVCVLPPPPPAEVPAHSASWVLVPTEPTRVTTF